MLRTGTTAAARLLPGEDPPRLGLAVGWQESSLMSGSSNKERP
jgi:hypothetical protein